jgi:hypothetical protein
MLGEGAYFQRRAFEECEAAMRASNLKARAAHLEMGRRYSKLAEAMVPQGSPLGIDRSDDPLTGRTYPAAGRNGA